MNDLSSLQQTFSFKWMGCVASLLIMGMFLRQSINDQRLDEMGPFILIYVAFFWYAPHNVVLNDQWIKLDRLMPFLGSQVIYLSDISSFKEENSAFSKQTGKITIITRHGEKMVLRSTHLHNFQALRDQLSMHNYLLDKNQAPA